MTYLKGRGYWSVLHWVTHCKWSSLGVYCGMYHFTSSLEKKMEDNTEEPPAEFPDAKLVDLDDLSEDRAAKQRDLSK